MMNYSGIVEIQKPCYTKNGIWENGSSEKKVIRNELCWDCCKTKILLYQKWYYGMGKMGVEGKKSNSK